MDNEISIAQALNHVQSWLNAGEFDKVIQGCQEILQIEPGNIRATALMKMAEERRLAQVKNEPMPEPAAPEPVPEPAPMPAKDPLASLQVEEAPAHPSTSDFQLPPEEDPEEDHFEKRKLFLAMLIPAVLVVLVGGGAIWWVANRNRTDEIEEAITHEEPAKDLSYLEENNQRVEDIQKMTKVFEAYKLENGSYPELTKVESVLAKSDEFSKIPSDPRQGEIDKAGKVFGYVYAVYSGVGGENSVYILSALFEDDKGFGTAWAQGAPVRNYPDFRDYSKDNVTFIGGDENNVETVGKGPNDNGKEPKVNPDN